jgi:hypothetical protein
LPSVKYPKISVEKVENTTMYTRDLKIPIITRENTDFETGKIGCREI